jgi:outer membrane protein assembly factor BamB
MSESTYSQTFEMRNRKLVYDPVKSILLCRAKNDGKKLWAKKVAEIHSIVSIIEDNEKFYVSGESGEKSGQFLAVYKENGKAGWFIPGLSFMQVLYGGFLYLIFVDEKDEYYLLKVRKDNGKTVWYYQVENDLFEYRFKNQKIRLYYRSNKVETISIVSGKRESVQTN